MDLLNKIPRSWWKLTDEEATRLNPPFLLEWVEDEDNKVYLEYVDDPSWINMGYIPVPKNRWQWLIHDLCNGWLMRYPWYKVFWFSLIGLFSSKTIVEINLAEDLDRIERGEEPLYIIQIEGKGVGDERHEDSDGDRGTR